MKRYDADMKECTDGKYVLYDEVKDLIPSHENYLGFAHSVMAYLEKKTNREYFIDAQPQSLGGSFTLIDEHEYVEIRYEADGDTFSAKISIPYMGDCTAIEGAMEMNIWETTSIEKLADAIIKLKYDMLSVIEDL